MFTKKIRVEPDCLAGGERRESTRRGRRFVPCRNVLSPTERAGHLRPSAPTQRIGLRRHHGLSSSISAAVTRGESRRQATHFSLVRLLIRAPLWLAGPSA